MIGAALGFIAVPLCVLAVMVLATWFMGNGQVRVTQRLPGQQRQDVPAIPPVLPLPTG